MLSSHVVLVAALSVIGCATELEPLIENKKKRKIDSLTDGGSEALREGLSFFFFLHFIFYKHEVLTSFFWGPIIHRGPLRDHIYSAL